MIQKYFFFLLFSLFLFFFSSYSHFIFVEQAGNTHVCNLHYTLALVKLYIQYTLPELKVQNIQEENKTKKKKKKKIRLTGFTVVHQFYNNDFTSVKSSVTNCRRKKQTVFCKKTAWRRPAIFNCWLDIPSYIYGIKKIIRYSVIHTWKKLLVRYMKDTERN